MAAVEFYETHRESQNRGGSRKLDTSLHSGLNPLLVRGAIELLERIGDFAVDISGGANDNGVLLLPIVNGAVAAVDVPTLGRDRVLY